MTDEPESPYAIGDIVGLVSGGPKMTVLGEGKLPDHVLVAWFDATFQHHKDEFPVDALVKK